MAETNPVESNTLCNNPGKKRRGNPKLKPRWKKGESGNPAGYSHKRRITDALFRKGCMSHAEVAQAWAEQIRAGNIVAIREAIDREEGKVPDKIDVNARIIQVIDDEPDV